jgi:branched-chain amino acid transport system ATP-binding protein
MTMPPLLELRAISRRFGGLQALEDVSFGLQEGEIFGLIGPNGAGKTTLFNIITGVTRPSGGQVLWKQTGIEGLPPHRIHRLGLARTFQNLRLFESLSCLDNVQVGLGRSDRRRALELLALFGLQARAAEAAGGLAYGDRRRLEMARALASAPQLLLLDEPAAGLNPGEKQELSALIRRLAAELHLTVLIIEHHVPLMMQLCDRLAVLNFGRLIALGRPDAVRHDPLVIEAYLGGAGGAGGATEDPS